MFSTYKIIQNNIYKSLKRGICNIKDDNLSQRLKHITTILTNKHKWTYTTDYMNKQQFNVLS